MELKDYQRRTLDAFSLWRTELAKAQAESEKSVSVLEGANLPVPADTRNYPKKAWEALASTGNVAHVSRPYVDRTATAGDPIPHVCFKIPTGGGKTLLGAGAIERLNRTSGLVLWMVPTNAIYQQTKEKLWDRQHPYRDLLERACGGRVKVMEKDDPLTAADVEHRLCIMLISLQSANRQKGQDSLRMNKDSGRYETFFPDSDGLQANDSLRAKYPDLDPQELDSPVLHSLLNVIKMVRPVVILDEAHKAYGKQGTHNDQYARAINRLNPGLVIELSATPSASRSNLLVDVSGADLQNAHMIKLPIQVTSDANVHWHSTMDRAHSKLGELDNDAVSLNHNEGRYVRPIAVVRVQHTGADQRFRNTIHAEDVRDYLTQNLGVPNEHIAVQSATSRELHRVDLLSESTQVRWIITRAALMEGWDCPFAYVLVMLDKTSARLAITQLVGRVMRQPGARRTGRAALDQCYVYCQDTDVNDAVQYVKDGLEQEGMADLYDSVSTSQSTILKSVSVQRREKFAQENIFLPSVLHADSSGSWEELDYHRHILPGISLEAIAPPEIQSSQPDKPKESTALVSFVGDAISAANFTSRDLEVDKRVAIAWYARRISDILPNPFQAGRIAMEMVERLQGQGLDDQAIYEQRDSLAEQLKESVARQMEQQAEELFRSKLARGTISLELVTSDSGRRLCDPYTIMVAENDRRLERYGEEVQLSLFEPVYERQFDSDLERRFAFYLDEQKALRWWHRIAVRQNEEYYLSGWRPQKVWPDFVAMAGQVEGKPSVLVFETKGQHLEGNDDTEYKKRLFEALEGAFNAGKMTIHDGPAKGAFRLVFDRVGFPDAQGAIDRLPAAYKTP